MAKTFNQFKKKIDELYWPNGGDEAKFMAMHGPYDPIKIGSPGTHDDAVFKGTIVGKDESHAHTDAEFRPDAQSELNDLIKNIHSKDTDELLKTVSQLNLSTDPKHREARDVINKELMYRYKNHAVSEELVGGQKKLDADGDKHLTAKDFAILRARKKKMNEDMGTPHGFVPKGDREKFGAHMAKAGLATAIQSNEPARDYSASANPRHGATKTHAAVRINTPAAKEHAKKFPGFTTSVNEDELDEGKFGNAMAKSTGKSKSPFVSSIIHGMQTRSAAAAAKKSKADPDNFDKTMNYANARNKVREESEVDEGYVSVNGQRVGGYRNRSPLSRIQKTPAEIARHKAGFDAVTKIIDKMNAPGGIKSPERSAKIDADLKKKRNAELTAAGRKPLPEAAVRNPYAVATSAAMKSTHDTPPLKKSTINKSHEIAKAIMGKKKVAENPELDKLVATEEIELDDGNVIEIDIELAEAIADLFDSLDEDDQDALAEMLHSDIESFMEVVDLLENDGE